MTANGRKLSIVVPAFREAPNLRQLCESVFTACGGAGLDAEMVIVDDDSQDGSEQIVADLASRLNVRILVRRGRRGLSTAVMEGFAAATHDVLLVMDADLQHPPAQVPDVALPVLDGRADICVGSRYVAHGRSAEEWPWYRRLNSIAATLLARPLTPVRDCMAGFFCIRRATLDGAGRLNPLGYKILLELLARARGARVVEVPIDFGTRYAGASKLSFREQMRYLRHLARLYRACRPVLFWGAIVVALAIVLAAGSWLAR